MAEGQQKRLDITNQDEAKETNSLEINPNVTWLVKYKRWLVVGISAVIVLASQSAATILGRLYYEKGGNSKWMLALVQSVGFPVLIPFLFMNNKGSTKNQDNRNHASVIVLYSVYVVLGIIMGGATIFLCIGLQYLPVSTYSIITATQLGFNVLFSFFLNSLKITPLIANSVVLLTISSILLILQPSESSDHTKSSKKHYVIGFACTLISSVASAFILTLTELAFRTVLKNQTMKQVMEIVIWQSFFGACVVLVGLLASGEWKQVKTEMQEFELGKLSYVMTLVWISLCWQIFTVGLVVLIMKVSALFANVLSTLGVPLLPILAIIIFDEKMSGVKGVSMVLAFWGFLSYTYQQYLDELKFKAEMVDVNGSSEIAIVERG